MYYCEKTVPTTPRTAIVLAGGKGTRMKSDLPKVLFPLRGRPMIEYVLDALDASGIEQKIVVVGYRADEVRRTLRDRPGIAFARQAEPQGTGHAVMVCRDLLADVDGPVFVVAGDMPMIQSSSVAALLAEYDRRPAACILGTVRAENPSGLGRILRDHNGNFLRIVEEKDATEEERRIKEVNMSYYVFRCPDLLDALDEIRPNNAQGEYYLTDGPGVMKAAGKEVRALPVLKPCEALGVNSRDDLAAVEAVLTGTG